MSWLLWQPVVNILTIHCAVIDVISYEAKFMAWHENISYDMKTEIPHENQCEVEMQVTNLFPTPNGWTN